jgi:uncharacterized protein
MKVSKPLSQQNTLIIGFPSIGLVGTLAISYLINHLDMKKIEEIDHPNFPPTLFVEDGEILFPIRIYYQDNIFILISELPMDPYLVYEFTESIVQFCKKNKIQKIIIVSGMETTNLDPIEPKIYGLVTHQSLEELLYANRISKFLSGSIYGTDAAMITVFKKSKIPTLILYAECHPFFPDPEASIIAITTLAKILNIKIDNIEIQKSMEQLRIRNRNLMKKTINALQQHEKPSRTPQIYR